MSNNVQDVTGLKLCKECGQMLPVTEFGKYSKAKDGLNPKCKECANRLKREWCEKNRDHVSQYAREYYEENRDHLNQYQREYYKENRDYINQYQREHYKENRDYINQYQREYRNDRYQNDPIFRRKAIARTMTMKAVYRGDLIRPTNCEICGSDEHQIQAHHESYEPGFEYDVRWVCQFCHAKIHATTDD